MAVRHAGTSEVAIFSRVLDGDRAGFSVAAARAMLALGFPQADKDRMRELSAKARDGILSPDEQAEINHYEIVGHIISLMKSKARRSLKRGATTNGKAEAR